MVTVRRMQRLWDERKFDRLIGELLVARIEASPRLQARLSGSTAAAALGLIRLDELNQVHLPLAQTFLRCVLATQGSDGGWNDPMLCALCIRALLTSRGQGLAIERGLSFLATMQKSEGIWPAEPIRRLPADAFTSAFILFQLSASEEFRRSVRLDDAIDWFGGHEATLDHEPASLWRHAAMRARPFARRGRNLAPLWLPISDVAAA